MRSPTVRTGRFLGHDLRKVQTQETREIRKGQTAEPMNTIEPEFQPTPKPIRAVFDGLRAIVRGDPRAAALLSEVEGRLTETEGRRPLNRFEQLKWKLYFDRWGCRECKTDRRLHHGLGYCKVCYGRVIERLQALEREWATKHRR